MISEKACLMLFALGMFVFDSQTLLPDRYDRDRAWRLSGTPATQRTAVICASDAP